MMNLFSSTDPSTQIMSMNWVTTILPLMLMPNMFWMIPSQLNMFITKTTNNLNKEFKILLKMNKMKGSTLMFISMLFFILLSNIMGLFPFVFSKTSHTSLNLTLSLPLWISMMIYGWMNQTMNMLTHLVPMSTPLILIPFMVCIETTSNIIRPMTLMIRLTANITAGHLMLTLIGNSSMETTKLMLIPMLAIQMLLNTIELAVSMIQTYVFSILLTLYSSESN